MQSETSLGDRKYAHQHGIPSRWGRKFINDADTLARVLDQVIVREEWMPDWADKWMKNEHGGWFCGLTRSGHAQGAPAPDLRPDLEGPVTLPIIDLT